MKQMSINYSKKREDGTEFAGQVTMNCPENLNELSSMWGAEVGYQKAMAQITIDARRLCYEADTPEEAQELVNNFTPGVSRSRSTGGFSKKAMLEAIKANPDLLKEVEALFAAHRT